MGVVYKAQDLKLDRFVVLKFLPPDLTRDEQAKARFINEARSASALDHPNICTVYEINESDDGQLFIAMAYYEGETLKEKVGSDQLSVNSVIEIATQIANGLTRAHEVGIVHRDIKPANIMVTKRGEVKILDFGLAKLAGQQHLTKTGATMGTIAYMSPEQTQGLPVDHRTDIWALGVVMYEMITGQLPFQGHYDQAVMYAIVNVEQKPVWQLRPETPMGLVEVVAKNLNKNPGERYQHVEELLQDLKTGGRGVASKVSSKPTLPRKNSLQKRWPVYALLAGLFAAFTFAGIHFLPKSTQAIDSIAVLPLQNLSGDPEQDYFADGMTEALIANLAKIKSLRVMSRTSVMQFKNTREPLPEIAKKLRVDAIVEGSVARAGNRVRITAQLIEAATDRHLWVENYDRDLRDVLVLQSEVTEAIMSEMRVQLTPQEEQRLMVVRPVDPEAYQLYLKGRDFMSNFNWDKGLQCFQKAISIDPNFAPAYSGVAGVYLQFMTGGTCYGLPKEMFPRTKAAALKALALDDTDAEAHAALGAMKFYYEWNWNEPERDFKRALELAPQSAGIYQSFATYLVLVGRFDEGIALHKKAIELDPLSPSLSITLAFGFFYARRYDEAIAYLHTMLQLYPEHPIAYYQLVWPYILKKMYKEALAFHDKLPEPFVKAYVYAVAGQREEALQILDEQLKRYQAEQCEPFNFSYVYLALGDIDQTFYWLNQAYEYRSGYIVWLKTEPMFDPIRTDPRYVELCRKIGLKN